MQFLVAQRESAEAKLHPEAMQNSLNSTSTAGYQPGGYHLPSSGSAVALNLQQEPQRQVGRHIASNSDIDRWVAQWRQQGPTTAQGPVGSGPPTGQ